MARAGSISFVLIFGYISGFLFCVFVNFLLLNFHAFLWLCRTSNATPNPLNLKGILDFFLTLSEPLPLVDNKECTMAIQGVLSI